MKVGTAEHRDLFCATFIDGHRAYEPEDLVWPNLEPEYLERLRAIPFWGIAKAMERKAGVMVTSYAQTLDDPIIRAAVMLQGTEETRHARLITHLIERYQLPAADVPLSVAEAAKEEFVIFGYEECVDFFMGAGLFRLATRRKMFPESLTSIFEHILVEEARHVTFFINWYRYEEARQGRDGAVRRHMTAVKNYYRSIRTLVGTLAGAQATGFAAVGAKDMIEGMTPMMFLEAALAENRRMLGLLDRRLVKPALLPALAATALTLLRALPPRLAAAAVNPPAPAVLKTLDESIAA